MFQASSANAASCGQDDFPLASSMRLSSGLRGRIGLIRSGERSMEPPWGGRRRPRARWARLTLPHDRERQGIRRWSKSERALPELGEPLR